uniref:Uncharacterized protein n=1 Tax=Tetranychus urticae TaxID=32264 RepID=T1JWC9_TETUR
MKLASTVNVFLDSYVEEEVHFWAITTQNEPFQAITNEDFFYKNLVLSRKWARLG